MAANLLWLQKGNWDVVKNRFHDLAQPVTAAADRIPLERKAANAIMRRPDGLHGVGPKQARNIWQGLGMTQFEIPLDSRVCGWANDLDPPLGIEPGKLYASVPYYEATMSAIQRLCAAAEVLPCDLDAAVFSSLDSAAPKNGRAVLKPVRFRASA